jgi:hypothetical protein
VSLWVSGCPCAVYPVKKKLELFLWSYECVFSISNNNNSRSHKGLAYCRPAKQNVLFSSG